jgi:hypothetical protein
MFGIGFVGGASVLPLRRYGADGVWSAGRQSLYTAAVALHVWVRLPGAVKCMCMACWCSQMHVHGLPGAAWSSPAGSHGTMAGQPVRAQTASHGRNARTRGFWQPGNQIKLEQVWPTQVPPPPDDFQQSWLLAETFKYLYLLFAGPEALDLNDWVLTTEAHPLRAQAPAAAGVAAQ